MNNEINTTSAYTTSTVIIYLSEYIQKYIIRIICDHLNKHNSKLVKLGDQNIKSLCMVNKLWFNSISNNLNVSIDFIHFRHSVLSYNDILKIALSTPTFSKDNESDHYIAKRLLKQQQQHLQQQSTTVSPPYRLLKDENVTELILNIDEWDIEVPTPEDITESLLFKLINYTIRNRYTNLKRVSISNIFDDEYWRWEYIEFDNIKIRGYYGDLTPIPRNIKEVVKFELLNGLSLPLQENAYQFFVNLNSIKEFSYSPESSDFKMKTLYETISTATTTANDTATGNSRSNCFSKTTKISSSIGLIAIIEDLYYTLKLAPSLKEFSSEFCIDNINYQLNKISGSNEAIVNVCACCDQGRNENFIFYWNNVIQMLTNYKSLRSLKIKHLCPNQDNYQGGEYKPHPMINEFSNVFIDQFSSIFKSKSISNLEFINFRESPQLVDKIMENGNLNEFKYNGLFEDPLIYRNIK